MNENKLAIPKLFKIKFFAANINLNPYVDCNLLYTLMQLHIYMDISLFLNCTKLINKNNCSAKISV